MTSASEPGGPRRRSTRLRLYPGDRDRLREALENRAAERDASDRNRSFRLSMAGLVLSIVIAVVSPLSAWYLATVGIEASERQANHAFLREQQVKAYSEFATAATTTHDGYSEALLAADTWSWADAGEQAQTLLVAREKLEAARGQLSTLQLKLYALTLLAAVDTYQVAEKIARDYASVSFDLYLAVDMYVDGDRVEPIDFDKHSDKLSEIHGAIGEFLSEGRVDLDTPACLNRPDDCLTVDRSVMSGT